MRLKSTTRRGAAGLVAVAVLATCGLCGCGLGPGESEGAAKLLVTSDYGGKVMVEKDLTGLTESSTVMRELDNSAAIKTQYGGKFVSSVNGLANGIEGGRSSDWFYFVDGVAGDRGGAGYQVRAGDMVWWDFRDWSSASGVQAVVGSFPKPLVGGFDGNDPGVSLDCLGGGKVCQSVESRLGELGADVVENADAGRIRVLVGPWSRLRVDKDAGRLEKGPAISGVFAGFKPDGKDFDLLGLNERAEPVRNFGVDAGLIAATRRGDDLPVWLVTAGSRASLAATAAVLTPQLLAHRYAAVVFWGKVASLPLPDGP